MMKFENSTSLLGIQKKHGMGRHGGYSVQWSTNKSSNNYMECSRVPRCDGTRGLLGRHLTETDKFWAFRLAHVWQSASGSPFDKLNITSMDTAFDESLKADVASPWGTTSIVRFQGQIEAEWGMLLGYLIGMVARETPREFVTIEEHTDFYERTMNNQVHNSGMHIADGIRRAAFPAYDALEAASPVFNARGDGWHFLLCDSHHGTKAEIGIPIDSDKFSVEHGRKFDGYYAAHYRITAFDRQYIDQRFEALDKILNNAGDVSILGNWDDDNSSPGDHTQYPGSDIYPELV